MEKNKLLFMTLVGIFAQMPLIHTLKDYLVKFFIFFLYLILVKIFLKEKVTKENKDKFDIINLLINFYILICLILDFIVVINPHVDMNALIGEELLNNKFISNIASIREKYTFLPLMLFSVINSLILQVSILISLFSSLFKK